MSTRLRRRSSRLARSWPQFAARVRRHRARRRAVDRSPCDRARARLGVDRWPDAAPPGWFVADRGAGRSLHCVIGVLLIAVVACGGTARMALTSMTADQGAGAVADSRRRRRLPLSRRAVHPVPARARASTSPSARSTRRSSFELVYQRGPLRCARPPAFVGADAAAAARAVRDLDSTIWCCSIARPFRSARR